MPVHTLEEAIASAKRMQEVKNDFRKEIGYVDAAEMRRVAAKSDVPEELADQLTEEAKKAAREDEEKKGGA